MSRVVSHRTRLSAALLATVAFGTLLTPEPASAQSSAEQASFTAEMSQVDQLLGLGGNEDLIALNQQIEAVLAAARACQGLDCPELMTCEEAQQLERDLFALLSLLNAQDRALTAASDAALQHFLNLVEVEKLNDEAKARLTQSIILQDTFIRISDAMAQLETIISSAGTLVDPSKASAAGVALDTTKLLANLRALYITLTTSNAPGIVPSYAPEWLRASPPPSISQLDDAAGVLGSLGGAAEKIRQAAAAIAERGTPASGIEAATGAVRQSNGLLVEAAEVLQVALSRYAKNQLSDSVAYLEGLQALDPANSATTRAAADFHQKVNTRRNLNRQLVARAEEALRQLSRCMRLAVCSPGERLNVALLLPDFNDVAPDGRVLFRWGQALVRINNEIAELRPSIMPVSARNDCSPPDDTSNALPETLPFGYDSTTFCTFGEGNVIELPLIILPPGGFVTTPPEQTPPADPPPATACPESSTCDFGGNPPEQPLTTDPIPTGERDQCDELAELKFEFDRLRTNPGSSRYDSFHGVPDQNREKIAALLPRIIELTKECSFCAERQQALLDLKDIKEELDAIATARRNLGLPVVPEIPTDAELNYSRVLERIEFLDKYCPQIEGFLELLPPPPEKPIGEGPFPTSEKDLEGGNKNLEAPFPSFPVSGTTPPGGPLSPCERVEALREALEKETSDANNPTYSQADQAAARANGTALEEQLQLALQECNRAREAPFPTAEDQPSPEQVQPPVIINAKATTRAISEGSKAPELAGQVIRLFSPADLDVALPSPRGEKPQDGHDRDPVQAVTDTDGYARLVIELPSEAFRPLQNAPDSVDDGGEPFYTFRVNFDATPKDSFNLIADNRDVIDSVLTREDLQRVESVDFSKIGNLTVATVIFDKEQGPAIRSQVQSEFPQILVEVNLCRIKEPTAVTEYHACKLGERQPPPGARLLTPPEAHEELRGARITLGETDKEHGQ